MTYRVRGWLSFTGHEKICYLCTVLGISMLPRNRISTHPLYILRCIFQFRMVETITLIHVLFFCLSFSFFFSFFSVLNYLAPYRLPSKIGNDSATMKLKRKQGHEMKSRNQNYPIKRASRIQDRHFNVFIPWGTHVKSLKPSSAKQILLLYKLYYQSQFRMKHEQKS